VQTSTLIEPLDSARENDEKPSVDPKQPKKSQSPTVGGAVGAAVLDVEELAVVDVINVLLVVDAETEGGAVEDVWVCPLITVTGQMVAE
jgi:hypothetical protein